MYKFYVVEGDQTLFVNNYHQRDNAIKAMIEYSENLKIWEEGIIHLQKNYHDLDCWLQSIDVFIDDKSTHLLQVGELKFEDKESK